MSDPGAEEEDDFWSRVLEGGHPHSDLATPSGSPLPLGDRNGDDGDDAAPSGHQAAAETSDVRPSQPRPLHSPPAPPPGLLTQLGQPEKTFRFAVGRHKPNKRIYLVPLKEDDCHEMEYTVDENPTKGFSPERRNRGLWVVQVKPVKKDHVSEVEGKVGNHYDLTREQYQKIVDADSDDKVTVCLECAEKIENAAWMEHAAWLHRKSSGLNSTLLIKHENEKHLDRSGEMHQECHPIYLLHIAHMH